MVGFALAIVKHKRILISVACLIPFLVLFLFFGSATATAAPACSIPSSGTWRVNSDCDLVRNESAPQNVVIGNGSTLTIPSGRSLSINLSRFKLQVASDSKVLVEPGGSIACRVNDAIDRPRSQKVDADPNLDGNRFLEILREQMPLSKHMGYVVSVQNADLRNVVWDASGYAISNCDPDGSQPFTIDTPTAWGSVSKLITASAVARLAQDSDQVDLGDRFGPHIPDRMTLDPKFKDVTYAQLLGHRAGLRRSSGVGLRKRLADTSEYPPEASSIADDFKARCPPGEDNSPDGKDYTGVDPQVGVRCYSNTGAGIAGRTILRAVSPEDTQTWENQHARDSIQTYDNDFKEWSSRRYLEAVKNLVLRPSSVDFGREANCNMGQFQNEGRPYTLSYISGADPDGELVGDNTLTCFSGGWVMSARHMARLMRTLRHSNAIVNRDTYREMTDCELGFDGRLSNVNGGAAFGKDGLIPLGSGKQKHNYAAYVIMLPGGYTAVAASNSGSSSNLKNALIAAFNASYSPPGPIRVSSSSCPYW